MGISADDREFTALSRWYDLKGEIAQYGAVIAGMTMSCSAAVMTSVNYDDVLAIAHRFTAQQSKHC